MILKTCIATNSKCYIQTGKGNNPKIKTVKGIVVHSTGANNKNLKRYVQPSADDKNYKEIIADIGKNTNNNSWNLSTKTVIPHACIGVNAKGTVETYQVLPYTYCCWGVGQGSKGSYNYNPTAHIQFEICEDGLKDEKYFNAVFKEAAEYCAYLCAEFGLPVSSIVSHKEAHDKGYASNHGDPDAWLKKFGKNMKWFRSQVQTILDNASDDDTDEDVVLTPPDLTTEGKIRAFQQAAISDKIHTACGYKNFTATGKWDDKTDKIAKKAEVKKNGKYKNCNKLLQKYLDLIGYDMSSSKTKSGAYDGIIGNGSVTAIKSYKKTCGFKTSLSVCGRLTWRKLLGVDA